MQEKSRNNKILRLCFFCILVIVGMGYSFFTMMDKGQIEGEGISVNGQVAFFDVNKGFYLVPLSQDDFATDV